MILCGLVLDRAPNVEVSEQAGRKLAVLMPDAHADTLYKYNECQEVVMCVLERSN
jgi:hypothetical protein